MNFTMFARFVAYFLFVMGCLRVAMALATPNEPDAIATYLGNYANTGEAVDRGLMYILVALALGTLTEISNSLKKTVPVDSEEVE